MIRHQKKVMKFTPEMVKQTPCQKIIFIYIKGLRLNSFAGLPNL